ncbi:O-linked N-acetylglucosamine transferase, SPINDLY family protein [Anabaena sp. UHCC 0399]|uniref:O-linked N-acetylglucosamine transferase, SPINDLY family protein n=1 Tax=Anabaena sp. UHCC 0399 TaxID=3110238 RepID=UPI002B203630|nr:O-linked N-acetylglucosamine transferase, SPINDLY family protein [Anabaena sp. UHCC 0399]MEA5567127.1 O-linked N-acetylglucosamine transferase, SPINDLY family protein [Anabaena sp. UHCC 0399]
MNKALLSYSSNQWQKQGENLLVKGNYHEAASLYEQAIATEPHLKSHYWYLGLMYLLLEQEVEAQTTWLMAIMEGEAEQVDEWNAELTDILYTEAERREKLEEYLIAWKIRRQIKEIYPQDIHNLLHLVQLSITLEKYTEEELQEYGLIELLQSEPQPQIKLELLKLVLRSALDYAPLNKSSLDLVTASVRYFSNDAQSLIDKLLPTAVDIAYSHWNSRVAARLSEILLTLDYGNKDILKHLAGFYQNAGELEQGIETAKKLYSLVDKSSDLVVANRQILRGLMTAGVYWQEAFYINQRHEELINILIKDYPTNLDQLTVARLLNSNYYALYIEDNPHKNRIIQNQILQLCHANKEVYAQEKLGKYSQGNLRRKKQSISDKKIKIGYLSHCLRGHSVGWLSRWLFQYYDHDKFTVNGYFIHNQAITDPLHIWYVSQVNKAYKSNNVYEVADQIYNDEIDILIDLDSVTLDTACEIMGFKPAPIQATWLGWDASGSPSIDYFIADPYVLPESAQEYYREKIWRLPQTYIAVDGFEVGVPTLNRQDLDIPHDAIIYFCPQRGFKLNPNIIKLQLRIIKEVPNSYFLVKESTDRQAVQDFFYQLANDEGVDTSKFRFIPDVPSEAVHRANLGIADIVLDTYPYNGATTTLETLWMCIPMVTRVGEQFAARNSYTMMMNAGITEGIAWTDEEYVEWGVRLGKDEALRQQIAWKLKQSRKTAPLWNGKQFTREMENAYTQMWQRYISS